MIRQNPRQFGRAPQRMTRAQLEARRTAITLALVACVSFWACIGLTFVGAARPVWPIAFGVLAFGSLALAVVAASEI